MKVEVLHLQSLKAYWLCIIFMPPPPSSLAYHFILTLSHLMYSLKRVKQLKRLITLLIWQDHSMQFTAYWFATEWSGALKNKHLAIIPPLDWQFDHSHTHLHAHFTSESDGEIWVESLSPQAQRQTQQYIRLTTGFHKTTTARKIYYTCKEEYRTDPFNFSVNEFNIK